MPTYGYRCNACNHEFESFHKITDAPLIHCDQCGKDTLIRVPGGGIGLSFKGTGYYITDYGSKKNDPKEGSAQESPPPPKECCPCGKKNKCSD